MRSTWWLLRMARYSSTSRTLDLLQTQKAELRKRMRAGLKQVAAEDVAGQSAAVTKNVIEQLGAYQKAKSICVFLSMPGREIQTHDLVRHALSTGKKVFVPYIHKNQPPVIAAMDMLELQSPSDLASLKPDAWGIPTIGDDSIGRRRNALGGFGVDDIESEQDAESPSLDVIFMPALAFDQENYRLGHGKGFYDRYLERYKSVVRSRRGSDEMPVLIGLALKQQLLGDELVPRNADDWSVDRVLTSDASE